MNLINQMRTFEHLDFLIRSKSTGTPKQLASRLEISERKVFRLLSELKDMGFPISYDQRRQSYLYSKKVKINFQIIISDKDLLKIKAGFSPSLKTNVPSGSL